MYVPEEGGEGKRVLAKLMHVKEITFLMMNFVNYYVPQVGCEMEDKKNLD